jgi:hypothetical protein
MNLCQNRSRENLKVLGHSLQRNSFSFECFGKWSLSLDAVKNVC